MLMLLCVQIVQTNNNKSNWREKKRKLFTIDKKKYVNLSRKKKILNKKNLVDEIHNLIIKEIKFNVNCHIKIGRNHNFSQV
jgi:hypothetical protein